MIESSQTETKGCLVVFSIVRFIFKTEKLFGRKISTPNVDSAVIALEAALDEVIYKADEPIE